jgi:hypothetical protein
VLDLAVGELVRPGLPAGDHAESFLVGIGQGRQRGVGFGEVGVAAVGQGEHLAQQQGPGGELPGPHSGRQRSFDDGRDAGGVEGLFQAG